MVGSNAGRLLYFIMATTTTITTTTTTATTNTSSSRQKLTSWGSQMIFLWPQKLHIVILYTPPDNIWRPDESETKNGKPAHPTIQQSEETIENPHRHEIISL